ncbi:MAG: nicotinate-nucleotide adenylyltransferase [Candidatus Schekmanbacteria bacterium]|nr:MAG: nicotinate-nucleotide adenylyltransferase [Candidatus Schekmanbacteria bacterium]
MEDKGRIGILGGTFNPIHIGHLRIAEEVREKMNLKEVVFVPSYIPPHKDEREIAPPHYRAEMVKIAIQDNPFFKISTIEIDRGGKSYTIDTVEEFKKKYDEDIYLISGIDTFEEFSTWHRVDNLLRACNFIVTSRPGYKEDKLEDTLYKTITSDYPDIKFKKEKSKGNLTIYGIETSNYKLYLFSSILLDISASKIRRCLKEGSSIKYLVPHEVEKFLIEKKIYI